MLKKKALWQLERDFKIVTLMREKLAEKNQSTEFFDKWLAKILVAAKPGNYINKPDPELKKFDEKIARNRESFSSFLGKQKLALGENELISKSILS